MGGWRVADYRNYTEDGGQGTRREGILTMSLKSWDDFSDAVSLLLKHGDFIWRGQRQGWQLLSTFQRNVKRDRAATLRKLTKAFKNAVSGRRGSNPSPLTDEYAIWSLGQHHGLPTPLLDWTKSPFVAAYFVFREKRSKGDKRYRFVYGLSGDVQRWGPASSADGKLKGYFIHIRDDSLDENARLISQRGCFTMPGAADVEIAQVVRRCYRADIDKGVRRIILVKIKIPETERDRCLRNLNAMNINSASLFPDLDGAAEYCRMMLEIKNYE